MHGSVRVRLSGRRPLSPAWRDSLRRTLARVLEEAGQRGQLNVVFVGDDEIQDLHRRYFGDDSPTDVITFPLVGGEDDPDPEGVMGEILISVETASREAERRDIPLERELTLYALHGVLHLLGYDDTDPPGRRRMRRAEARHLARWEEEREA